MSLNRNRDLADGIERLRGTGLGRGMHRNIRFCQENQEMDGAWDHRLKDQLTQSLFMQQRLLAAHSTRNFIRHFAPL